MVRFKFLMSCFYNELYEFYEFLSCDTKNEQRK